MEEVGGAGKSLREDVGRHPRRANCDEREIIRFEALVQPGDADAMGTMQVPHGRIFAGFYDSAHRFVVAQNLDMSEAACKELVPE